MKRTASLLLAILVIVSLLTACSKKPDPQPATTQPTETKPAAPVELQFFYPVGVTGPLAQIIGNMVDEFNKAHPAIKVTATYAGGYGDTLTKTITSIKGGTPPDLAVLGASELYTLLDMDAVLALDDLIAKDGGQKFLDDFYPGLLKSGKSGGKLYSLPFQRSTQLLYYNKDAFKEVGLNPEQAPKTWTELSDAAKKLTKKDGANVVRWGVEIPTNSFIFQGFALQNGAQIFTEDGKKVFYDRPDNVEALQFWADLAKAGVQPPGAIGSSNATTDFLAGKAAMLYTSTGSLGSVRDKATFNWGVAFMPAKKQFGTPTGGANVYVIKSIPKERQQTAWTFVKWLLEPERVAKWSIETGYIATRKSAYDVQAMKDYTAKLPQALVARDQLQYASAEMTVHNGAAVTALLDEAIQAVVTGKKTSADALKEVQTRANQALADWNK